jgi:hypothetical protein
VDPNITLHLGKYRRYLWEESNLLVVIGDFSEVVVCKQLYEEGHGIPEVADGERETLERIMAAACLAAVSLAQRESWGWTLTLSGSSHGFFCGVEPEGMICGTVQEAPREKGSVYLQRQKAGGPVVESHYYPTSKDPVAAVQRYFEQVEQIRTRIALGPDGSGVLVQAMPEGDFDRVADLADEEMIGLCRQKAQDGGFKALQEVLIFYECRCDDKMIQDMIDSLPDAGRAELWEGQKELSIQCPRCAREYVLKR